MCRQRNAYGLAVLAIVLSGCSPSIREWWTEDLRDPRARMSRDTATRIYASPQDGIVADDIDAPPPRPLTSPTASALIPMPDARPPARPQVAALPPPRRASPSATLVPPPQRLNHPAAEEPISESPSAAPVVIEEPILPANGVSLAGLSEAEVRNAIGHPDDVARKGPQTIWTYGGSGCSVEVIFFVDVISKANAALDTKTVGADGRTPSAAPCTRVASVAAARR